MPLYCQHCKRTTEYRIVRMYTDGRERRWEVYRCVRCKHEREYAVS